MHCGQRLLELLRRRHPDKDGAHRRVGYSKACGGFGQAPGKSLFHKRLQPLRAFEIHLVTAGGADRLWRWAGYRVAFCRVGERAAGKYADAHHADAGRLGMVEQPTIVLRRIICRKQCGGGCVQRWHGNRFAPLSASVQQLVAKIHTLTSITSI